LSTGNNWAGSEVDCAILAHLEDELGHTFTKLMRKPQNIASVMERIESAKIAFTGTEAPVIVVPDGRVVNIKTEKMRKIFDRVTDHILHLVMRQLTTEAKSHKASIVEVCLPN
jgi:hypothetical protein